MKYKVALETEYCQIHYICMNMGIPLIAKYLDLPTYLERVYQA